MFKLFWDWIMGCCGASRTVGGGALSYRRRSAAALATPKPTIPVPPAQEVSADKPKAPPPAPVVSRKVTYVSPKESK